MPTSSREDFVNGLLGADSLASAEVRLYAYQLISEFGFGNGLSTEPDESI